MICEPLELKMGDVDPLLIGAIHAREQQTQRVDLH